MRPKQENDVAVSIYFVSVTDPRAFEEGGVSQIEVRVNTEFYLC
jgi:hypothetical protein